MENPLKNKRYVNLIRCSTEMQADTSPAAQIATNNTFAKRLGMKHVTDIVLEGVSGSKTFNRRDLDRLIEEKKLNDSYDVILFRDFARLTRGGIGHGHAIKRNFAQVGVQLQSVMDQVPEGPIGEFYETFLFYQNQDASRSLASWLAQSLATRVKSGRKPAGSKAVYGFDKMLFGPDGKPTRIVRWTPTERLIMHPVTRDVIETVDSRLRFLKQKYETYKYVLGDTENLDVVRWILEQFHKYGRTTGWIARTLNDQNTPSARGS